MVIIIVSHPPENSQPKAFIIKPFIFGGKTNQSGSFLGKGQPSVVTILGYSPNCPNVNGGAMYLVALSN